MTFDVFNIFISNKAEALMASVGPPLSLAFREILEEEAERLQKIALHATKAAVPIDTHELQQDIVASDDNGQWRVTIQGTIHISGSERISTDKLAFKLDNNTDYRRTQTNFGFGNVVIPTAGALMPTEDWIKHAQDAFSQLAGF